MPNLFFKNNDEPQQRKRPRETTAFRSASMSANLKFCGFFYDPKFYLFWYKCVPSSIK